MTDKPSPGGRRWLRQRQRSRRRVRLWQAGLLAPCWACGVTTAVGPRRRLSHQQPQPHVGDAGGPAGAEGSAAAHDITCLETVVGFLARDPVLGTAIAICMWWMGWPECFSPSWWCSTPCRKLRPGP